ncbi:MAG: phosphoribosylanthranilate isomerase [Methanosarcinaceae archaeon]|nr:phosphoribosylanthranilate isomerase [Methanosarcinaceae archaeon]
MKVANKQAPRVKICGMKSAEDIELAVRCGANAVGLIADVPVDTPRKIDTETAIELASHVPLFVDCVLVIMPADGEQAVGMIDTVKPDVVQLHSDLSVDNLQFIRDNTGAGIVKTFSIPVSTTSSAHEAVEQVVNGINDLIDRDLADGILLDSSKAGKVGGTGVAHDWSISRVIVENVDIPVILAGGLKPYNVRDAVLQVHPYAVDTSSGIETNGKKDGAKMCRFVKEAKCEVSQ